MKKLLFVGLTIGVGEQEHNSTEPYYWAALQELASFINIKCCK